MTEQHSPEPSEGTASHSSKATTNSSDNDLVTSKVVGLGDDEFQDASNNLNTAVVPVTKSVSQALKDRLKSSSNQLKDQIGKSSKILQKNVVSTSEKLKAKTKEYAGPLGEKLKSKMKENAALVKGSLSEVLTDTKMKYQSYQQKRQSKNTNQQPEFDEEAIGLDNEEFVISEGSGYTTSIDNLIEEAANPR